ncbi:phenolphthiocerol synthesis polyketide synthase type I Pks15/1 domain protein [Mycobacterium xenopi 4042]|uniref:Phenolphthiocerol synthesis polyketide synthase type I Pks15/1 domain protein n=1 Tax=Mycobacterium xenopi 4042 TaxID=1299334 RepID=X7YM66_MYCXE|nr:phenolphthiocerol synthesis polyketide synthase type I Pks15/1 domain protein [Mycobacterium xenopi 4042]
MISGAERCHRGRGPAAPAGPPSAPARGVACLPLAVDGAHDRRVPYCRSRIRPAQPTIPIVSNLTGQVVDDDFASPQYWTRTSGNGAFRRQHSLRAFGGATASSRWVGGGLTTSIEESLPDVDRCHCPCCAKTARPASLTAAVAQAFVSGMAVDWRAMLPGGALWSCRRMPLSDAAFGCPATVDR